MAYFFFQFKLTLDWHKFTFSVTDYHTNHRGTGDLAFKVAQDLQFL